ncbi:hypothetical protein VP01_1293g3 [Puccinia sorghi]|uniref:mannan endo-1,4-beta-mannosidase n=1 Tax=Puccinia sorghi TaxID=27349 RepID=A0A0L6VNQ0_9BASI|nr:hypothetical protein VP01_1293g3 [Puccinia sorghi]
MRIFPIFLGVIWTERTRCDDATAPSASSTVTRTSSESHDRSHSGFVRAPGDGNLYLDGNLFNFRSFKWRTNNLWRCAAKNSKDVTYSKALKNLVLPSPERIPYRLLTRAWSMERCRPLLGTSSVGTRTRTVFCSSSKSSISSITRGDRSCSDPPASLILPHPPPQLSEDWIYNEDQWKKMDLMLCLSRHYGVKLIIPIINQVSGSVTRAYGNPEINHVGDFNDLIRHRYGIWGYLDAGKRVDFFKDRTMINSFKSLITFFLNRVNTCNGIRYGDDNTILAFETGNEMSWGRYANLSGSSILFLTYFSQTQKQWTIEISHHLKTLAPNILVMDGSLYLIGPLIFQLPSPLFRLGGGGIEEQRGGSLRISLLVDGDGDTELFDMLNAKVRKYGKTLVIGEHGFCELITLGEKNSNVHVWRDVYKKMTCAGALAWSLLPHSEKGGFLTRSEGHNIYAYHVPGWKRQTSPNFDTQEDEPPPKPIPGRPEAFIVSNGSHVGLSWRGEAWAAGYEIFGAEPRDRDFHLISDVIPDNVEAGKLFIPLDPERPTEPLRIPTRKSKSEEPHKGWRDRKWCWRNSFLHGCHDDDDDDRYQGHHHHEKNLLDILGNFIGQSLMTVLSPMEPPRHRHRHHPGGWYSVRGVSADGIRGKPSRPVFLDADWRRENSR